MRRSRSSRRTRHRVATWLVGGALIGCGGRVTTSPAVASCATDRAVVLASQADIARIASCTTARGVMIRSGGALDTSALRALTTITGDLVIGPTVGVEHVTLGELRTVGGTIRVASNGLLQGVFLPRLEHAGRIEIDGNAVLTTLSMPRLVAVHGELRIVDNVNLELVDVSALAAIDQALVLAGAPRLALVEADQLQRAASVEIDAAKLPPDVAARLRAIAAGPSPPSPRGPDDPPTRLGPQR